MEFGHSFTHRHSRKSLVPVRIRRQNAPVHSTHCGLVDMPGTITASEEKSGRRKRRMAGVVKRKVYELLTLLFA